MDVKLADSPVLSLEDCHTYIHEKVFPLRPLDYCSKYPNWPGLVGIEIEMLPVLTASLEKSKAELVPIYDTSFSLSSILASLKPQYPDWTYVPFSAQDSHLISVQLDQQDQITFEPGGQLEFSSKPYPCLSDALQRMDQVQSILDSAAAQYAVTIMQIGMNPWRSVDEIGLQMQKPRYQAMDRFFAAQSVYGQRMMRQTCTIQLNLDFGANEETLAKRYLLGNLIAPMATAIFANSPLLEGKATGLLSNRASTWQHMDPSRTGFPKLDNIEKTLSREACVRAYADWILKGKLVFVEGLGYRVMDGHFTLKDWIEQGVQGLKPTLNDLRTHLSLQFPEVRARGFLELRSVDCQARHWQAVPCAFYTGLLYDEQSLDQALQLLLPYRSRLHELWQKCVYGLQDNELSVLVQKVARLAYEGFGRMPACYQGNERPRIMEQFLERYTWRRLSPADDLLAIYRSEGGVLPVAKISALEETWKK